jgi:hypothetical protein
MYVLAQYDPRRSLPSTTAGKMSRKSAFALLAGRVSAKGTPALLDLATLLRRHADEIRVVKPSPGIQRVAFAFLAPFARLFGRG